MLIYLHQSKRDFQVIRCCGVIIQSQQISNSERRITDHVEFIFVGHPAWDVKVLEAISPRRYYWWAPDPKVKHLKAHFELLQRWYLFHSHGFHATIAGYQHFLRDCYCSLYYCFIKQRHFVGSGDAFHCRSYPLGSLTSQADEDGPPISQALWRPF